ncbi:hypothetical protein DM01DRAFT_1372184 [Hesseltinella vesiculosa]|uniref:Uncharacterized protein n=1 Tax=Hesseltinella vesiculosa TaxID=101127 RepID=A0A1X2GNU9_9FUNG|nr:hypothetical protein DM01DRAFT_1372184 [Hesseltinella vesiculosa]
MSSIGFGEAKVCQRSGARHSLCIDTLPLITFCKNAIDVNKLDGAIAFQIHGMHITFFLMKLTAAGVVENLPSFFTLVNVKKLLAINNAFWRYCKESTQPEKTEARYAKTLTTLNELIDDN